MKTENWQQLDKLFHLALGRDPAERSALLDKECADNTSLRKQVEALLTAHDEAGNFMESSAFEIESRSVGSENSDSLVGRTIGNYKILSSIGEGGMGEVYLGQDLRLGRTIALKLLPAVFTQDSDRVQRFQQEARAASALNHPNIITIHEIGLAANRHFIATEFIDGETLRQHIIESQSQVSSKARIWHTEALSIAMQVADALTAAHAKGIVHRDIKPENVILVKDSYLKRKESFVKLLDFGIAKLVEEGAAHNGDATTRMLLNTHEGSVIGTTNYMSPEQARGEKVDGRTDIWSLGIVLYEMLTCAVPFGGNTAQDVIASILKEEPPPLPIEIPDKLRWIVEKALRKDKEERYQTAREMFSDLRALHREEIELGLINARANSGDESDRKTNDHEGTLTTSVGRTSRATQIPDRRRVNVATIGLLTLALALVSFAVYKYLPRNSTKTTSQNQPKSVLSSQTMKISRLTSNGRVTDAVISPDGKYVVHVANDGKHQSVWMKQVSSPTSEVPINVPGDFSFLGLTFSPDGDDLYFIAWNKVNPKEPFTLYRMPLLGGTTTKLVSDIDSIVSFSPNGKQFAYMRGNPSKGELALLVANNDGTHERTIATRKIPARASMVDPAWSPDGNSIIQAVDNADAGESSMSLVAVQVADGLTRPITSQRWWRIERVTWLRDGSGLIFIAREETSSPAQVWYLSYPDGEAQRITNDLKNYLTVSLTADGNALVSVESERVSNIWIVPNDNAMRASQITSTKFDGVEGISWTPDGKIVYASRANDKLDLWMVEANGTGLRQLTAEVGNNKRPSVSPDGRHVVFVSDRTGTEHIWRADIDGSHATQLTNGDGEKNPQISPDSKSVIYQLSFGKTGIWKVPIGGGEPVQLVDKPTRGVAISPDSKWIATSHFEFEPPAIRTAIYPFEGGEPLKIVDINSNYLRWTQDSTALAYVDNRLTPNVITLRSIDNGPAKPLLDFSPDLIFCFAWSNDRKNLAVARGSITQDVILISNFKNK